jgi:type II protein arginine methyltransferase
MSTRLEVGIDVEERFDIIISEVLDLRLLGEGIIPSMRHAVKMLLAPGGAILPSNLHVYAMPIEVRLFHQAEKSHNVDLGVLRSMLQSKESPVRLNAIPHRCLCDEAVKVFSIDLRNIPNQPENGVPNLPGTEMQIKIGGKPALQATMTQTSIDHAGTLHGNAVWWNADYGHGVMLGNGPESGTISWKQLIRWIEEPRWVTEGEACNLLSCYGDRTLSVDDIYITQEMMEAVQKEYGLKDAAPAAATSPTSHEPPAGQQEQEEDDDEELVEVD